jgi:RND family efflux transporter MFP subunit
MVWAKSASSFVRRIVWFSKFVKNCALKAIYLMNMKSKSKREDCLGAVLFLCLGCFGLTAHAQLQSQAQAVSGAPTSAARVAAPEDRILVQAWAETETVISSPIIGLIQQIPSRVGQPFNKNETVVQFDCTENEAKSQIAQSELTGASENLEAKIRLKSMNAASDIEVTTAAAQVAKAEAQLKLSQHQVSQCKLTAPFTGHVVRVMGKPFQTATVGQPLLEMISAGVPKLRVSASSKLFTKIRIGTPLRVTIDETGLMYRAVVSSINARIDPVNQTFEMEARLQRGGAGLLPGMSGTAVIAGAASPVSRVR